ncbi:TrkH family potassium uptake protein [Neorhizobium sp. T786]|uniref:TrkH family potassium uptake protein n=1 Tax=Pseudorhizobium xiangyangii TaxID=2883104 RepID=UPI001CFFA162|nr:TrkH family potassium uptake protein [Neorhizobium xiangyangii]MCB5204807.1 TrkH family potassium uptake protein [Neorhizobium xiangyangii]
MNASLFRPAIYIAALCGLYLATAMFLPAMMDLYYGHDDWQVFALSGFMVGGLSMMTALATRGPPPAFNKRLGFLLVNLLWATFSIVGAIPLYLAENELSFAQALFESVSGITTTGSTVITGLDTMPRGILLWRSLLCWFGGIGIVALGLFILPFLKVGGMSVFKLESSDTNDKPFARLASFTRAFIAIYLLLTLTCMVAYDIAGMGHFDALNHAMSTVATAGFSTRDMSFAYYDSEAILVIGTIFLTIGSLPFSVLILLAVRRRLNTLRDPQILVFISYLCAFSILLGVYHHLRNGVEIDTALIHSFFNMASILSTGGFASDDYTLWGPFAVTLAFFATAIGGCSGSTAGGIKTYRFVIIFNIIRSGLKRLIYPNAVYPVRYGNITVEPDAQRGVFLFVSLFLALWAFGSMAMSAMGYDFLTATSAVLTCLANVGPGIGPIIGPVGNFSTIGDPALYLLSLMMLLGRLEILTVLVLLTPIFWRQ